MQKIETIAAIDAETATVIEDERRTKEVVTVHWDKEQNMLCLTSVSTHCGKADFKSTYRQSLVSMLNSSTYFAALTLLDTDAYSSFVNRDVAKWLEQRHHEGTVAV